MNKTQTIDFAEVFQRIGKANAINAAPALIPALENLKDQVFQELAYIDPDPLNYARIAGKAQVIDALLARLLSDKEDGKQALHELQTEGN